MPEINNVSYAKEFQPDRDHTHQRINTDSSGKNLEN
jgi:hypothetical protein